MKNNQKEIFELERKIRDMIEEIHGQIDERSLAFGNMTVMPREMEKLPYHTPVTTSMTRKSKKTPKGSKKKRK